MSLSLCCVNRSSIMLEKLKHKDLKHKNMFLNYNLKYMNDRGEMTFISQDMVGQEEGHQEVSCQSHQSHDWCWSASEVHWIQSS